VFWRTRGKEALNRTGRATVNGEYAIVPFFSFAEMYVEPFWVDLVVHNPFNTEVHLSNLTLVVTGLPTSSEWDSDFVDVEILDEIVLDPKETRTVNIVDLFYHVPQADFLGIRSRYRYWQDNQ